MMLQTNLLINFQLAHIKNLSAPFMKIEKTYCSNGTCIIKVTITITAIEPNVF